MSVGCRHVNLWCVCKLCQDLCCSVLLLFFLFLFFCFFIFLFIFSCCYTDTQVAAENMLSKLIYWIRVDDSELGVPKLPGAAPSQELARPMMLLNVLTEFCGDNRTLREKYSADFDWAVQSILKHVRCLPLLYM